MKRTLLPVLLLAASVGLSQPAQSESGERVPVMGQACYTHGDNESPLQARNAALDMAKQRAVENHHTFVESLGAVKDFQLEKQMVRRLAAGSLYEVDILDQSEDGRRFCASITASIDPAEVEAAIQDMRRRSAEAARQQQAALAQQANQQSSSGGTGQVLPSGTVLPAGAQLSSNPACAYEVPTSFTLREAVYPEQPISDVRQKLLDQAANEAVRSVQGTLVQSKSAMLVKADNDQVDERFMSRLKAQSRGFVRHEVTGERMEKFQGRDYLLLDITAYVCMPDPKTLKKTVAVTHALTTRGETLPEMVSLLESTFGGGGSFSVVDPNEAMIDVAVGVQINSVSVNDVTVSSDVRRSTSWDTPKNLMRVVVDMTLTATENRSGERLTEYVKQARVFPANGRSKRDLAEGYVSELLVKAANTLYTKAVDRFVRGESSANTAAIQPNQSVTQQSQSQKTSAAQRPSPAGTTDQRARPRPAAGPQW